MKLNPIFITLLSFILLNSVSYGAGNSTELPKADLVFILFASVLVFFMQAGFCLLEMGFSRAKNAINIVMKNMCDMSAGVLGFFFVGFGLMFGWSEGGIVGTGNFGFSSDYLDNSGIWVFFLFQAMFAATTVTISSGAMAERTYFPGYLVYAVIACTLIYPFFGHWVWGGAAAEAKYGFGEGQGWLKARGFEDFAGATVVHAVGGAFALAGILTIGPRKGRYLEDGTERIYAGHNIPFGALGMFILFFGWFGFNCGSNLSVNNSIGFIAVNTVIAGSAALISGLLFHWLVKGWADPESAINGCLGGLVAITACCNCVEPWAAAVIGIVAGVIVTFGSSLLSKLRLDDAVGAIPVHLFCGIFGTLCVSLFNKEEALAGIGIQAIGAFVVPISAFCVSWVVFQIIDKTIGLRASDEAQDQGLDFAEHSATAYPDFASNDEL